MGLLLHCYCSVTDPLVIQPAVEGSHVDIMSHCITSHFAFFVFATGAARHKLMT